MVDKDHHYPRKGNIPMATVYSTLDKYGDPKHTLYGGKLKLGGCQTGAGTWWPDYCQATRDFSPGGINHPTEFVFLSEVVPFTHAQRAKSMPAERQVNLPPEKPQQFRHPQPSREALWKSTNIMPYKPGGRRKCAEASNWKAALASGKENGGRTPIWCKGPLLDNPDFHQKHPLRRGEEMPSIHQTCVKEALAAGGATGTNPVDALLLSSKTSKALGMRDSEAIRADMTMNKSRSLSHSMTFKSVKDRLNGHEESFRSFRFSPSASTGKLQLQDGSIDSIASADAGSDEKLPNWIATSTVASRDPGAAGGQSSATSIRRIAVTRSK